MKRDKQRYKSNTASEKKTYQKPYEHEGVILETTNTENSQLRNMANVSFSQK